MTIHKVKRLRFAIAGLVWSVMLTFPAAHAAGPPGDPATEQASAETKSSPLSAQQNPAREERVVFVGPRRNVKMRFDADSSPASRAHAVERKCKGRTYYVGPRQNIKRTFKRDCGDKG